MAKTKKIMKINDKDVSNKHVPADYMDMGIAEARRFDAMVRKNFMPAIISTAKQAMEDYGVFEGVCLDLGCGTTVFAIELCRRSSLKIYGLTGKGYHFSAIS